MPTPSLSSFDHSESYVFSFQLAWKRPQSYLCAFASFVEAPYARLIAGLALLLNLRVLCGWRRRRLTSLVKRESINIALVTGGAVAGDASAAGNTVANAVSLIEGPGTSGTSGVALDMGVGGLETGGEGPRERGMLILGVSRVADLFPGAGGTSVVALDKGVGGLETSGEGPRERGTLILGVSHVAG